MEADPAAQALREKLRGQTGDLTVADAAARSGLALRDAERGLFRLLELYPGNLKATSEGELLFSFPDGLDRLRNERTLWQRTWDRTKKVVGSATRFLLRAWIAVATIGYAAIFLGVLIGLALSGRSDSDRGIGGIGQLGYVLVRVILEALFWTFHPAWSYYPEDQARRPWGARAEKQKKKGVPFYAKVNRFVFGPEEKETDPREHEQLVLAEIRRQRGRIGVSDVMRVTGLQRQAAEPFIARLMLDYEGEVDVSDDGGITYRFEKVRRTASEGSPKSAFPKLLEQLKLPELTGNSFGSNFGIAALNGFNLLMAMLSLSLGVTVADLFNLWSGVGLQPDGMAIALGAIPALFSAWIFAMPIFRALRQPSKKAAVKRENGRRGVVKKVLDELKRDADKQHAFSETELKAAWKTATGDVPDDKQLSRTVIEELGGDVEVTDAGRAEYRFRDLEAEVAALEAERRAASATEQSVGDVVFEAEEVPR